MLLIPLLCVRIGEQPSLPRSPLCNKLLLAATSSTPSSRFNLSSPRPSRPHPYYFISTSSLLLHLHLNTLLFPPRKPYPKLITPLFSDPTLPCTTFVPPSAAQHHPSHICKATSHRSTPYSTLLARRSPCPSRASRPHGGQKLPSHYAGKALVEKGERRGSQGDGREVASRVTLSLPINQHQTWASSWNQLRTDSRADSAVRMTGHMVQSMSYSQTSRAISDAVL